MGSVLDLDPDPDPVGSSRIRNNFQDPDPEYN